MSLVAVFDGHGGREVSNFTVTRFAKVLKDERNFSDDLATAMAPAASAAALADTSPSPEKEGGVVVDSGMSFFLFMRGSGLSGI